MSNRDVCYPRSTDPLVDAAWAGRIDDVQELLAQGHDPNCRDERGTSPMSAATRQGQYEVMRALLAAGADPHEQTDRGDTLLGITTLPGNVEGMRLLLEAGADPNANTSTILMQAAFWGGLSTGGGLAAVQMLIDAGADVNAVTSDGRTALSASGGEDELVRLLMAAGAVVRPDVPGQRPLLVDAIDHGRLRPSQEAGILRLIAAGADIQAADKNGVTPLKRACSKRSRRVVAALLESGARRVGATKSGGYTSRPELHLAAVAGSPEIVRMLLHDGADRDETDSKGRTPLYRAANYGREEVIRVLLTAGADPDAGGRPGLSPLRVAAFDGHAGCVALLLAAGADAAGATAEGVTALHLAVMYERNRVVPLLLAAGADPNGGDSAGRTPLHWAVQQRARADRGRKRARAIVAQLLAAGADPEVGDREGRKAPDQAHAAGVEWPE